MFGIPLRLGQVHQHISVGKYLEYIIIIIQKLVCEFANGTDGTLNNIGFSTAVFI
jgi:hypothetical protein